MLFQVTTRVVSLPHPDSLPLQEVVKDMLTEVVPTLLASQDQLDLSPRAHSPREPLAQVGSQSNLDLSVISHKEDLSQLAHFSVDKTESRELVFNPELLRPLVTTDTMVTELGLPQLDSLNQQVHSPRETQSHLVTLLRSERSRELVSNPEPLKLPESTTVTTGTDQVSPLLGSLDQQALSPKEAQSQAEPLRLDKTRSRELESNLDPLNQPDTVVLTEPE